jgi:hypothetical protein
MNAKLEPFIKIKNKNIKKSAEYWKKRFMQIGSLKKNFPVVFKTN